MNGRQNPDGFPDQIFGFPARFQYGVLQGTWKNEFLAEIQRFPAGFQYEL